MVAAFFVAIAPQTAVIKVQPNGHVKKVAVIGDFNHWNAPGTPLKLGKDGITWQVSLKLEPGVYKYAVVLDNQPVPEPSKHPSLLIITPPDFARRIATIGDGFITESGLQHRPNSDDTKRLNEHTFEIHFRTRHNDVRNVSIAVSQEDSEQKNYAMKLVSNDILFDYYEAKVVVVDTKPFRYRFLLDDGDGARSFDKDGLSRGVIGGQPFKQDPMSYPLEKPLGI